MRVCTAPKHNSRHWKQEDVSWDEIVDWARTPAHHKECGAYLLGELVPTAADHPNKRGCVALHRRTGALRSRSAITLDADYKAGALPERVAALPWASLTHSTYSSAPDNPRYRIILPTDRDMDPEEYQAVATVLVHRLGRAFFDPTTTQPLRYMFRPATQNADWYTWQVTEGKPVPVDKLLAEFDPQLLPAPKVHHNKRDPYELAGVVGAFNRAYRDWNDLIATYELPYVQKEADRWALAGSKSESGLSVVTDGLVFSHHATDPAAGRAVSAFDLVRLHRYGDLDVEAPNTTPINRLPSTEAMMSAASTDARVVAELVGLDFDPEVPADDDWKLKLAFNSRTGRFADTIDNWDLVRENDRAFATLVYNEMTMTVETNGDLPWRSLEQGAAITSTDRAALAHYLEREYKIRPTRSLLDELVDVTASQRRVHPIRDYLLSLKWDGEPRMDTSLPGVEPTPYTRMVARKCLVAAVARILDPGIKWDHSLILYGKEGLGKSWWVQRMARGYSASLGRVGDKDTLLTMQRSWIMLADEGHSLRKADADAQKEFLTRTADVFRMPYDRETHLHPRHCVIWGTTNDEVFLRRQEGNRRFLIVKCEQAVDFDAMTDEYVDQVWAEAVYRYRAGEKLFLAEGETEMAAEEREFFTEEDALLGLIQGWLDHKVPPEWEEMHPEARQTWIRNRAEGFEPEGTETINRICSSQVWVEVLGRRLGDHRRTDLLEINAALKRLPGWVAAPTRHRLPFYGPQQVYVRADFL